MTTNAVTTGSLFGIGDVSAQFLFPTADMASTNRKKKERNSYDFARTARAVIYGSMIFSFIGDKWYKFLNFKVVLPIKPKYSWFNQLYRVTVDQLLFAPLGLPFYFGCMTAMEGKSMKYAKEKIKEQWWDTLKTNWLVWPAFQLFNFSLVPIQHRLLAVNVVAIFWNTFLSYKNSISLEGSKKLPVHYPPAVE